MWLLPTDKMATRAVKKRILPLVECNPQYRGFLPYTMASYSDAVPFKGFPLYYSGTKNASKLASIPANVIIMDESAKFERGNKIEADPISLARERTKSFADSLVIMASTPNIEEHKFWQTYLEGTQSKFWVPCPHCGKHFVFEWGIDSVVWEEGKPTTAKIVCPACKGKLDDRARIKAMRKGEWRDSNPAARALGKISYHLSSLYSCYVTIGEMA